MQRKSLMTFENWYFRLRAILDYNSEDRAIRARDDLERDFKSKRNKFYTYPGLVSCKSIQPIREATEAKIEQDSRCVLVANLHLKVTEYHLRKLFKACGTIKDIEQEWHCRVKMGYAYVEFKDPESVVSALELNGSTLMGYEILVERKISEKMAITR